MASYKRLVKLKSRIKAQKTIIKQQEEDLDAINQVVIAQDKHITELDGVVANLMPDGTVGSRINSLEAMIKAKEERIRELEKSKARMQQKVQYLDSELAAKDAELKAVVDREHKIHNESAAGMIQRVKGLEAAIDLASRNEAVWTKQIAKQYLVIKQLKEEVTVLERAVNDAAANEGELRQANVKLQQDLEQARGSQQQRDQDLEDVIERLEAKRDPDPAAEAGTKSGANFATSVAGGLRKIREMLYDADDVGYIDFLENKIKEKDRRIENMVGELEALYDSSFDKLDEASPAKQINELAEVLMHEFGHFFDRSEGAVDMAIRLLRGFSKS